MPDARAALDSAARRAGDPARQSARGERRTRARTPSAKAHGAGGEVRTAAGCRLRLSAAAGTQAPERPRLAGGYKVSLFCRDERMSIRHAGFAYKSASITLSRSRSTAKLDKLSAALPREMPQWHALLRSWRVAAKLAGSSLNKKGLSDSGDSLRTHLQSIGKFGPADKKECPEKLASHSRPNFLKSTHRTQNAESIYDFFTFRGFSTFAILV